MNPTDLNRRLTVAVVLVVLLLGVVSAATAGDVDSYADALARAAKENKPVVIDFYTDW